MQEICRDIRKLDHAKSNLTATITAFRRLSMLVTAVGATLHQPHSQLVSYVDMQTCKPLETALCCGRRAVASGVHEKAH